MIPSSRPPCSLEFYLLRDSCCTAPRANLVLSTRRIKLTFGQPNSALPDLSEEKCGPFAAGLSFNGAANRAGATVAEPYLSAAP
jgi:hypothetical protein